MVAMPPLVVVALGIAGLVGSAVTVVGSDALWLSALGDHIWAGGAIPSGIPYGAAPSREWVNTTVLGQLLLSALHGQGSLGLVIAQVVAAVGTLLLIAFDALCRGARSSSTALVVVAVSAGAAAPLFIARAQLLSLVPFSALLVLLRRQQDRPTAAVWWSMPLLALWGNLHGAVLIGVAVLGCYLMFSRLRQSPATAIAVALGSLMATCLNPGLLRAPRYYLGVFNGGATSDESGMWSRVDISNPFDLLLVLAAVALGTAALRRRRPLWEYAAGLGLVLATFSAARHGLWLLIFLAVPAATAVHRDRPAPWRTKRADALTATIALASAALGVTMLAHRAPQFRAADAQAASIAAATRGHVVLAPEPLVESLAAAGAVVWASNPLDAFAPADQAAYLAFLRGDAAGAARALTQADVVVTEPHTPQARAAMGSGYTRIGTVGGFTLFGRG
ncbi:hypothetical protein GCM10009740_03150 [Terrabacter terrae]|uniref:Glycosyltransferase RgtA/B/C/D-like domain-containing protein n=1 Tax=Terrabacter terrae TaxID=318434 RepID=A0ABN2TTI6_9MICO